MGKAQSVWPVNELGEIVSKSGIGTSNITGFISQDQIPVASDGKVAFNGIYPGGDTSKTFQLRATYSSTLSLPDNTEVVVPLFTNVEAGAIGVTAIDQYVLAADHDGTVTGALELHVHTTGSNVDFNVWLEASADQITWFPVPNSLKKATIATTDQIVGGSLVIGNLYKNLYTRLKVKRVGGNSCELASHVFTTSNGDVSQPSVLIRLYGI